MSGFLDTKRLGQHHSVGSIVYSMQAHLQAQLFKAADREKWVVRISLQVAELDFNSVFGLLQIAATEGLRGSIRGLLRGSIGGFLRRLFLLRSYGLIS
jgi:hypothetical protein